jgi:threonine/homoserine/homoserine lactone efflux protein
LLFNLALTVSPGPNFALVSRLAISGSRQAALGASVGIAAASVIYAVLSMTGLAVLMKEIGWLAGGVQIVGGCYLVYLGLSAWFDAGTAMSPSKPIDARNGWYGLRSGFLVDLSNPKGITFFVGLYAAVIPYNTALWAKAVIIAGGFSIEVMWYGLVAMLLSTRGARAVYTRMGRWAERLVGTLLLGFGLRLIYDRS